MYMVNCKCSVKCFKYPLSQINGVFVFHRFGGKYPHEQVENVKGRSVIQQHVYYTPDYDFYIFDIYVWGLEKKKESGFYVPYDEMIESLKECEFTLFAKELFRGSFEECLNFDCQFSTKLPTEYFQLPPLKDYSNICEGVVIKPVKELVTACKKERFLIKKKNEAFKEVTTVKKPPRKRKTIKKPEFKYSEASTPVFEGLMQYMNPSRLESAISKVGDIMNSFKLRNKCLALLVQDALADYQKEHLKEWEQVPKEDKKLITKFMSEEAKEIIVDYVYEFSNESTNMGEEEKEGSHLDEP